ncbi:AraC family transcriptional regulator [Pseudomarimonas arenosa]|uniref:Helix-turn-helix transcriptional regulator n=1 Tax=Pseudomarimonas arenosa TaxID=2774145 RepID=A0AAW3ZR09_9GAMM|nr:helix-turn-helix domain-containing protein [Pseudomarimonas arenosa]MBD8527054.1 helix-turn-helix transcriptional regulator [Pseudomarimonas arenosa]
MSYYPGRMRMAAHAHRQHQLSILLGGGLRERGRRAESEVELPAVGFKPADFRHANEYGERGALILSLNLDPEGEWSARLAPQLDWQWRCQGNADCLLLARALLRRLERGDSGDCQNLLVDLLAALELGDRPAQCAPPNLLLRCRQHLLDAPQASLNELAHAEAVHPVHLSRSFQRHFGCPLSVFRARLRFSRALPGLSAGGPIAHTALDAGFADQAHFTRAARQECGLTPGQLVRLLAAG